MKLHDVQKLLDDNNYTYNTRMIPSSIEYYESKGFKPRTESGPFLLLTISNPNHEKEIEMIFSDASDDPDFYDLSFGGYWYEMFDYRDEELPNNLPEEIRRIVSGQAYIIFSTDGKTGKWFADQIYYDLPEADMNDMDSYKRRLSRIKAPKSLWRKLIGRTDVYEIFNWFSYQKVIK